MVLSCFVCCRRFVVAGLSSRVCGGFFVAGCCEVFCSGWVCVGESEEGVSGDRGVMGVGGGVGIVAGEGGCQPQAGKFVISSFHSGIPIADVMVMDIS